MAYPVGDEQAAPLLPLRRRRGRGHGRREGRGRWNRGPCGDGPLRRRREERLAGGVASGVAAKTGFDITVVRIVFVVGSLVSGVGAAAYVLAWLLVPAAGEDGTIAPRALNDRRGIARAAGLGSLFVVALILASALGVGWIGSLSWPLVISVSGLVLIWRNADPDEQALLRHLAEPLRGLADGDRSNGTGKPRTGLRLSLAALLFAGGLLTLVLGHASRAVLRPLGGVVLVLAAIVLVLGPWWLRLARDLVLERQARVRAEDRAEMASRVHDSVLQTLALIQRRADDPQRVVQLARAQERELRSWLFDGRAPGSLDEAGLTVAAGVRLIQEEVEAQYGLAIEAVTVSNCDLDDDLGALLAAAREATVNAAKWSGADVVSLFTEVEPTQVSIFVRGPRPRIRPGCGTGRPARARRVHPGADGAARWFRDRSQRPRRGHRGVADDAARCPRTPVGTGMSSPATTATPATRPRVFIVDDHALFRSGVRSELGDEVEVVGEADDVVPAIIGIRACLPDVVLLDVHLPGGGGHAVLTALEAVRPRVRFLALSASDGPEDVIAVIRAGARGYVTKTISGAELVDAVRRVALGEAVFSPRLAGFVLDAFASLPPAGESAPSFDAELDQLTTREREVLRLIARGYTYREIGRELHISVKTVESHVSSVLRKLQLSTRHQLTRWATERRLT